VKRHDLAVNWVVTLLQVAHWFNPLVWVAFYRWRADRELACDALALEAAGPEQNQEYGRTILRLLRDFTARNTSPGLVGILEDKRQLDRRIRMIAGFRPGKRAGLISAALAIALGIVCLTDAQVPRPAKAVPSVGGKTNKAPVSLDAGSSGESNGTNVEMRQLTITVLNPEGKPLPGAKIEAPYVGRFDQPRPLRLTDDQGRYTLEIPVPPAEHRSRMTTFSIRASHQDYAPRALGWTSSGGDVYAALPNEATVKLQKGIPVGGTVLNGRKEPLAGVRVVLTGSGYQGFTMGTGQQKAHEYPELHHHTVAAPTATTDQYGRWAFTNFPPDLSVVEISLIRPDDSVARFSTSPGHNNVNRYEPASLTDLLAGKAEFLLPDGVTVRGIVVDETGKPIAGTVVKEGYGHGNVQRVSEITTGEDGRFERPNRVPRQWIYTASKAGRATVSVVAQVQAGMPEVRLVLPPEKPLRLRVVDADKKPVSGASFRLDNYRNEAQLLDWSAATDSEGWATWTNAPTTVVALFASTTSPPRHRKFKVQADGNERELVLPNAAIPQARVTLRATDQQTREPLVIAAISAEYNGGNGFKKLSEPKATEALVEIRQSDFMIGMSTSYKLKVEAAGHEPFVTEFIDLDEGDQELILALPRGGNAAGVALLADGKPAKGARVWVRPSRDAGSLFCNDPGRYYGDRLAKAEVGTDGKFEMPQVPEDPPVVFTHADGFLETVLSAVKRNPEVRLQPWSRIEGRALVAGQPKGGLRISLSTLHWSPAMGFNLIYSTTSNPDGRFVFTNVPAGAYKLYRQQTIRIGRPITEDHPLPVEVKPGEVVKVDYYEPGRPVIGQAVADVPEMSVDWQNDDHVLVLKQPPVASPNREDFATFKAFLEANNNSFSYPARIQQQRAARTYVLMFERDGSFRAEDVPPGTYELRIQLTKPGQDRQAMFRSRPEDELGALVKEVIVPPGKDALDLGELVVPLRAGAPATREPALDLEARSLDGRLLSLAKYRGQPVLLVFWATWSDRSREQMAQLQKIQADPANSTLKLINVCIDGDAAAVKEIATGRAYRGEQAFLDKAQRGPAIEKLHLETLPAVFLLDEKGRVVGRDFEGERLQASLRRMTKAK